MGPFFPHQQAEMKAIAVYLLAIMGGNRNPTVPDLQKILASVNATADEEDLKQVVDELVSKSIYDVMDADVSKLCSSGAPRVAAAGGAAAPAAGGAAAPAAEEKPAEEEEEEEDEDMGFGLFD